MRRTLTCGASLLVCSTVLALAFAQEHDGPETVTKKGPLDLLLAEFAAATGSLDIEKAEKLFLPPDDTPAGRNRQAHLSELRKDWTRAKECGATKGPAIRFQNTKLVVHTQMAISGPGGPTKGHVSDIKLTVTSTQNGWKIVSMETGAARGK